MLGLTRIVAAAGWDRSEVIAEVDKVYDGHTPEMTLLVARFDVTGMSEDEIERLAADVTRQAQATDRDEYRCGHPPIDVVVILEHVPAITREP